MTPTDPITARWVVLDIEGTLMATSQIHVVLYDYARPRLGPWIDEHQDDPRVMEAVAEVCAEVGLPPDAATPDVVRVLHTWMDADRKAAPLKTLQGLIWEHGYACGNLTSECFPDVVPALRAWREQGLTLAVFSSGSAAGQIASFAHTTEGDLRELFTHHFDTVNVGPKRESESYMAIARRLGASTPGEIMFLSDVPAELDAAVAAGWRTVGVTRRGEPHAGADFGTHIKVVSFTGLTIEPPR